MIYGLNSIIDIYELEINKENRIKTTKEIVKIPKITGIRARVINDNKIITKMRIDAKKGDVIIDTTTKKQYDIEAINEVCNINNFKYTSVDVKVRKVGEI